MFLLSKDIFLRSDSRRNKHMEKIGVGYAYVSDAEKRYVNEALDSGRLSQGKMVHKFENEFARLHDQKYGVACNSGTSRYRLY